MIERNHIIDEPNQKTLVDYGHGFDVVLDDDSIAVEFALLSSRRQGYAHSRRGNEITATCLALSLRRSPVA